MRNKNNQELFVSVDLTDACNQNCIYCYKPEQEPTHKELSIDDLCEIFLKYEPYIFQIMGGEPTLEWEKLLNFIDKIYPKMKEGQNIVIFSNGTTGIDFETIPKQYRDKVCMAFSIDGFEELNDAHRGQGVFKLVTESIKRAKNAGLIVGTSVVRDVKEYMRDSEELTNFIQFLINDLKVDGISFNVRSKSNWPEMMDIVRECKAANVYDYINKIAEPFRKYCDIDVKNREALCRLNRIHVHTDGKINPRCSELKCVVGHFSLLDKNDIQKWLDYCNIINFDCRSTEWKKAENFINGILMAKKNEK